MDNWLEFSLSPNLDGNSKLKVRLLTLKGRNLSSNPNRMRFLRACMERSSESPLTTSEFVTLGLSL